MKKLWVFLPGVALFLGILASPDLGYAQEGCQTPEGCKNENGYQACVEPSEAQTPCAWEDCSVDEGFCQLSDCCEEECCVTEEEESQYEFAADLGMTAAGTYAGSPLNPGRTGPAAVKPCRGFIVAAADEPDNRPLTITLE